MSMSCRIEPRKEYLYVQLLGTFELDSVIEISEQFLSVSADHCLSKILVDAFSIEGEMSVHERFEYAKFMAKKSMENILAGTRESLRLAYVGNPPIVDPEKLGEIFGANRGVRVIETTDINEAFAWLRVESEE